jgi:molecular chaperone GrpE
MSGIKKKSKKNLDAITAETNDETLIPLEPDDNVMETGIVKEEKPESKSDIPAEEIDTGKSTGESDTIDSLTKMLDEQQRLSAEYQDKMLRAQAELENMRKRMARDIENAHKYALDSFVTELLPILDSMELGISASANTGDINTVKEGLDLTFKMFTSTLEKFGVAVVDPQGEKFNPEQHEAVSMQDSKELDAGSVISVMQKGYALNGRLVRPAMVIVAK